MMDNCCAPQWADFTRSPQVLSDNYFEVEHEVHEPLMPLMSDEPSACKAENVNELTMTETKFDDSLEPEPEPASATCTKIAYFIPHDNKKGTNVETEQANLTKAMKTLKLNETSNISDAWTISATELKSAFTVSTAKHKSAAVPERIKNYLRMAEKKSSAPSKSSAMNVQENTAKRKINIQKTNTKINSQTIVKSSDDNSTDDNFSEKRLSYKIISAHRGRSHLFKTKRYSVEKSQHKVLTCQYRRKSLIKYRRCSNQFVSLAEAVSKFQNGTPQRFRTLSNRDAKPGPLIKIKRSPLKLTYPVSPALRCKQRSRQTNILSQQEREQMELEEMKKHYIKANPLPVHILKGPCVLKKVAKKPVTVTEEFHLTQSRKARYTTGAHTSLQLNTNDKEQKHVPTIIRSNSASNVTKKECVEAVAEKTKPIPFSFEARNKELQMKKEEKLRNLHDKEINKVKAEFHARPAPKFSKPANPAKEQNAKKKQVVLCPFSFEERDKTLAKKKEELVKQIQEKEKKTRVFHANPVPNFKPVAIHGLSKEKEKCTNNKEIPVRQSKSCYDQENKQPNIIAGNTSIDSRKKEIKQRIIKNEPDKQQCKNSTVEVDAKNDKLKTTPKKIIKFELNTDKRAKERQDFEEKIKKKEQELEMKKREEEKNRLLKEKVERAELRKMAEVRARPMPVYKPMVVSKSTKPATSPKSPAWWASRIKPKGAS